MCSFLNPSLDLHFSITNDFQNRLSIQPKLLPFFPKINPPFAQTAPTLNPTFHQIKQLSSYKFCTWDLNKHIQVSHPFATFSNPMPLNLTQYQPYISQNHPVFHMPFASALHQGYFRCCKVCSRHGIRRHVYVLHLGKVLNTTLSTLIANMPKFFNDDVSSAQGILLLLRES